MEQEIWNRLNYRGEGLGKFYLVSNLGNIKGVKTNKIRKKNINHEGYYYVSISLGSRKNKRTIKIHIAVADTFIGYVHNKQQMVVNHIDGCKLNNNALNLEYCTYLENYKHAEKIGLIPNIKKKVMCVNNGMVFNSISEANSWMGKKKNNGHLNAILNQNKEYCWKDEQGNKIKWKIMKI